MRKIREVLRLHSSLGCTHRQIASACHISPSTVGAYIDRATEAGLTWTEVEPLSDREQAVLRYLPTMMSNAEIASELFLSVNTVKTHLKAIYRKLGAARRREAVERARRLGLL